MKLSIVGTLYQSAPYVKEFCERIAEQAQSIVGQDYEIVLVNDGSPDNSCELALMAQKNDPRIRVVDLSRNFGHHPAILTGLGLSRGDYVFLIDTDLEEPPETLSEFWDIFHKNGNVDVVAGMQIQRLGSFGERVMGRLAWRFFSSLSSTEIPVNTLTARLMSRRYLDALSQYNEKVSFLDALTVDVGFRQVYIPIQKSDTGQSTYTFRHKMNLLFNGITAYSTKPLLLTIAVSGVLATFTFLVGLYALIMGLLGAALPGWASTVFLVSAATTIITFLQGMNGLYVAHIFSEVKNRPRTVIREIYDGENMQIAEKFGVRQKGRHFSTADSKEPFP